LTHYTHADVGNFHGDDFVKNANDNYFAEMENVLRSINQVNPEQSKYRWY